MEIPNIKIENIVSSEVVVPYKSDIDFTKLLDFFLQLGFRLDVIYPAESPKVATLFGYDLNLRIIPDNDLVAGKIILKYKDLSSYNQLVAPNGTIIEFQYFDKLAELVIPQCIPQVIFSRSLDGKNDIGRAGMMYRDLLPGRLGGKYIASKITIANSGIVKDWVHYHHIKFQMIFCLKGSVRLVYEDQGEPFWLHTGDCVTQPPLIRHRVLESSENLHVVEIGCPAEHFTIADHEMSLPNSNYNPERKFKDQLFLHHVHDENNFKSSSEGYLSQQFLNMMDYTNGITDACIYKKATDGIVSSSILKFPSIPGDTNFCYVIKGSTRLIINDNDNMNMVLNTDDSISIPLRSSWEIFDSSDDFQMLHVTLIG